MKLLSLLITLLLVASCNKDKTEVEDVPEQPYIYPNSIPAGDSLFSNLLYTNIQPDISQSSFNVETYTNFDIDSDGIDDYQFIVNSAYPFAGTWFNGCTVRIKTLTSNTEIALGLTGILAIDSVYLFPKLYLENDSIENQSEWGTGEIYLSWNGDVPDDGCYAPNCPNSSFGPWFGMSDKYIGVRLDGNRLGWFKVSFPSTNVNTGQTIIIHEYGVLN